MDRELPVQARTWGRILDTSHMEAGDLFLTRLIAPETDRVSRAIIDSQERGGFHRRHAQWTHAAVYLGDDEYVCEANFKIPGYSNGVILRSAFFYCDGSYAIRVRRPRNMTPKQRLRIAIGALSNLGVPYSWRQLLQFSMAANRGRGFWEETPRGPRIATRALVCSTLYQDAFTFALQGNSVRLGKICTPAHLSASTDFEPDDPQLAWLGVE